MVEDPIQFSHETRHLLKNHIQVTDIKLDNLEKAGVERHDSMVKSQNERHQAVLNMIARLESALKWAGGLVVSLTLAVLGWALMQQVNANEAQKKDMQQQLDLLRAQTAERERLQAAGTAQAPSTAVGR